MDSNKTKRNRLTRMRIGESILRLLERTPLSDIKISRIAKVAGISRMTFYHYYETKEAALTDYLTEVINQYINEATKMGVNREFHTHNNLEFTLNFFAKYDKLLLRLEKIGCYNLLIDSVNHYLEDNYKSHFKATIYNLYFYAGAVLNVFMQWIRNGKKESAKEIADIILMQQVDSI